MNGIATCFKNYKLLISLALLIIVANNAALIAQPVVPFDQTPEGFVKDFDNYMNNSKRDDCKTAVNLFKENIKSAKIDGAQLGEIMVVCNIMNERKMNPAPHMLNYLNLVNNFFTKSLKDQALFEMWNETLKQELLKSKKGDNKNFAALVEFFDGFMVENVLFKNASKSWSAETDDFKFETTKEGKPIIRFSNIELKGKSISDSISIYDASGYFVLIDNEWFGDKGRADWQRVGIDSGYVHVQFKKHYINMEKAEFRVDSAVLTNYNYLKMKVLGVFEDKLSATKSELKPYPKFESYTNDLKFEQFADNVKLKGGLGMSGSKVNVKGTAENPAIVDFYRLDKTKALAVRALSDRFVIKKDDEIFSNDALIICYINEKKDSIVHPGLNLNYKLSKETIVCTRGDVGVSKATFNNSFQKVEMETEQMKWDLKNDFIDFKMMMLGNENAAFMESNNYFQANKYDKYQNTADYNIISKIKQYSEQYKSKSIPGSALAKFINPKFSLETIERTLYFLVADGFIFYDKASDIITVKPKTYNYVLANAKLIDYDVIRIKSNADSANFRLRLNENNMDINGVNSINVSDSQNVIFYPQKKYLLMKGNRDMDFAGMIVAGRVDLYGKNHKFLYTPFTVDLPNLDSLLYYIPDPKADLESFKKAPLVPLTTTIEKLNGMLSIDGGNNKSGKQDLTTYPIIDSKTNSYTYYDKPTTSKGVYNREKFYYELRPFKMDSLDKIEKPSIRFEGKMVSGGIFPDFEQELYIMPDRSLGFENNTPTKNFTMYGNIGTYAGNYALSNNGLLGNGTLNFQTTTVVLPEVQFFMDSTNAKVQNFTMKKSETGIQYPQVTNDNLFVHWEPYKDSMLLNKTTKPFDFVEWQAKLTGDSWVTSKGYHGRGAMDWAEATLTSKNHEYKASKMHADASDLRMKSLDSTKVVFNIPNVKSDVDFQKQIGDFKSNDESIVTSLPYNKFETTMNEFQWEMKKRIITFKPPADIAKLVAFTSTDKLTEGLTFNAKGGRYDLNNYLLTCTGVGVISIADSKVLPDSSVVYVEPEGKIRILKNAKINADTLNNYHLLTACTLNVIGKNEMQGSGETVYTNNANEKQTILFTDIHVNKDEPNRRNTLNCQGLINEEQNFKLDRLMKFKGKSILKSERQYLTFDGYSKLQLNNKTLTPQWFNFNQEINPDNIIVELNDPVNESGDTLSLGINYGYDTMQVYTVFLDKLKNRKDFRVFSSTGLLKVNEKTKDYEVGDTARINGTADRGNLFKYNDATSRVSGEGKLAFGDRYGLCKVESYGNVEGDVNKGRYDFDCTTLIDFPLHEPFGVALTKYISDNVEEEDPIDYLDPTFEQRLKQYFSEKEYAKKQTEMLANEMFTKPKDFAAQIMLTNLKLQFDSLNESFRNKEPFGVAYLFNQPIDKIIKNSYCQFGKKKGKTYWAIYLESDEEEWLYLYYVNNYLYVATNDKNFSTIFTTAKPDDKKSKGPNGTFFQIQTTTAAKAQKFKEQCEFSQKVYNGKIKYSGFTKTDNEPEPEKPRILGPDGLPIDPQGAPVNPDGTPVASPDGTAPIAPEEAPK